MLYGPKRERGVALLVALAGLGFLTIMFGALAVTLFSEGVTSRAYARSVQAHYFARAGLARAMHELNKDSDRAVDHLGEPWHTNDAAYSNVKLGRGGYHVSHISPRTGQAVPGIVDEESKLNVNKAERGMLRALPGMTEALADAILARRDRHRFAGVGELQTLHGVQAPAGIGALVTVYGEGRVNVNTATAAVLDSLPGLDQAAVARILAFRNGPDGAPATADDRFFRTADALRSHLGMNKGPFDRLRDWIAVRSTHFTVTATGRVGGQRPLALQIRAVVERRDNACRIVRFEESPPVLETETRE